MKNLGKEVPLFLIQDKVQWWNYLRTDFQGQGLGGPWPLKARSLDSFGWKLPLRLQILCSDLPLPTVSPKKGSNDEHRRKCNALGSQRNITWVTLLGPNLKMHAYSLFLQCWQYIINVMRWANFYKGRKNKNGISEAWLTMIVFDFVDNCI